MQKTSRADVLDGELEVSDLSLLVTETALKILTVPTIQNDIYLEEKKNALCQTIVSRFS